MDLMNNELLLLAKNFDAYNVKYLLVGGFAVNFYGYKRTTGDVDIYLKDSLENRQALIEALDKMKYGRFDMLLTVPIIAGYCEILMDNGMYADLMTDIPGLEQARFDKYYEAAAVNFVDGIPVRYIHYNHLVQNKQATKRNKDLIDVEELNAIRNNLL